MCGPPGKGGNGILETGNPAGGMAGLWLPFEDAEEAGGSPQARPTRLSALWLELKGPKPSLGTIPGPLPKKNL